MRRILITGAAGNLGSKLRSHLALNPRYELLLLDKAPRGDTTIIEADLSSYVASWVDHFSGADDVVHLAAEASSTAAWPSLVPGNVDATINVFEAAIAHGVRRVVFASSLHAAMAYEREPLDVIASATESNPTNFYGATKAFGERLGRSYADRHGLSVICMRLGYAHGDRAPHPSKGALDDQMRWLSTRDFCGFIEGAILAEGVHFAVFNATSRVSGSKWDLSDTIRTLGYTPQDTFVPPRTALAIRLRRLAALFGR